MPVFIPGGRLWRLKAGKQLTLYVYRMSNGFILAFTAPPLWASLAPHPVVLPEKTIKTVNKFWDIADLS